MNLVPKQLALVPLVSLWASLLASSAMAAPSPAASPADLRPWCRSVIVPQASSLAVTDPLAGFIGPPIQTVKVKASVEIEGGTATTVLAVALHNPGPRSAEAELLLPLPPSATVTQLRWGPLGSPLFVQAIHGPLTHELLPAGEAYLAFRSLAERRLDSGPLEFTGMAALRSSVFELKADERQTILITYEEAAVGYGQRLDYELPRSESLQRDVPWEIDVRISSKGSIADVYSPTHGLDVQARGAHDRTLTVLPGATGRIEAGPFKLSVLSGEGPMASTIFTAKNPDGPGGWFVFLAGLGDAPAMAETPPREVTIVLDRSGSMGGAKFDQAIAAARQVLEGLEFGEAVQIIDYSNDVAQFAAAPVIKTKANLPLLREYLGGLSAGGGTNLDGALQSALGSPVTEGFVPVVLFLTDGLATVGEKREHVIRDRAIAGNVHDRRVFTFGVGHDVNASLLDAVADRSRARATYVDPGANVEVAVADVFEDLSGPIMTGIEFEVVGADGALDTRLVRDVYPGLMPDLFRGDRLLLVGRYTEARPATLRVRGKGIGGEFVHEFAHSFAASPSGDTFVPRLWAMRRIAYLEDSLRQLGADPTALASLENDPRFQETVKEMLNIGARFGVLTDSTAVLVQEETQLGDAGELLGHAYSANLLNNRARSGASGVSQQKNIASNRAQAWVNSSNLLADASGRAVANCGLQTIRGRAFLRRGARWTEGSLALNEAACAKPDVEVYVGSVEYAKLLDAMVQQGRGSELSLDGEILIRFDGMVTLIKGPGAANEDPKEKAQVGVHH